MFTGRDIAGFQGKEVQLWTKAGATFVNLPDFTSVQIRGAQNFNPGQEEAETKVSELGLAAQKTIYGTISYTVATSLLIRDLVNLANLSGVDTSSSRRLYIGDFKKVNCINWVLSPEDESTVIMTVIAGGYKPRMASDSFAVNADATVNLDGSADSVQVFDGKATVREHVADGACKMFLINSSITSETQILSIECPSGNVLGSSDNPWNNDGVTFTAHCVNGECNVVFTTAPVNGSKVRIVYTTTATQP